MTYPSDVAFFPNDNLLEKVFREGLSPYIIDSLSIISGLELE